MSRETAPATMGAAHLPLRGQVRDLLRDRIVSGKLKPGDRMIERELATEFGVSRIPIREAIRMLESEGFVTVVPRRGVIVRSLSEHDVRELFDVREALEVLAVRRVAERATSTELRELAETVAASREALAAGDTEANGAANESFHDQIIELARNDLLASMIEPLLSRLHWLFRQSDDPAVLCDEHQRLLDAIRSGDADAAGAEALVHVRTNRERALRLMFGHSETPDVDTGRAG